MTVQNESTTKTHGVILTEAAATKAKSLLDQEGRDDLALRIAVQPGGCAGLRYNLFFDDRTLDGDLTADFGGVTLTVDRMSAPYVEGASIDFVDTIEKQGFTIDNPNATRLVRLRGLVQLTSNWRGRVNTSPPCAARTSTPKSGCAGITAARCPGPARASGRRRPATPSW